MGFGKMDTFIDIVRVKRDTDSEGFKKDTEEILASVQAYREGRHGSEKWANRAAFSSATDFFRFRVIPGLEVTTDMAVLCGESRFQISSVEDVKGRGMYLEVLAEEVKVSGKG
jgi:head-tail adaptor